MIELYLTPLEPYEEYPDDISRIVKVCEKNGYVISRDNARRAWEQLSDKVCASWLYLPEDDGTLLEAIVGETLERPV